MLPDLTKLVAGGPAVWIRQGYEILSGLPGGKKVFARLLGAAIPYTGSLGAEVIELRPGYARVGLDERRAVQNHLKSIHAIALANLAELTGNLALVYGLPDDARFIVRSLCIEYVKKARGRLTAECHIDGALTSESKEHVLSVSIRDAAGDVVAESKITTLVGPVKQRAR